MIFLSYAHGDAASARLLVTMLLSRGVQVWIDRSRLAPGSRWRTEVSDAISRSTAVIVLLSSASLRSHHVEREVALADDLDKPLVPVFLDDTPLPPSLQLSLAGIHRIAFDRNDPDTCVDRLLRALPGPASRGEPNQPSANVAERIRGFRPHVLRSMLVLVFVALAYTAFRALTTEPVAAIGDGEVAASGGPKPSEEPGRSSVHQTDTTGVHLTHHRGAGYSLAYPDSWLVYDASGEDVTRDHFRHPDGDFGYSVWIPERSGFRPEEALTRLMAEWRAEGRDFREAARQQVGADLVVRGVLSGQRENWHVDMLVVAGSVGSPVLYQLSKPDSDDAERRRLFAAARRSFQPGVPTP